MENELFKQVLSIAIIPLTLFALWYYYKAMMRNIERDFKRKIKLHSTSTFFDLVNQKCHAYCIKHLHDKDYVSAYEWLYEKIPPFEDVYYSDKDATIEVWIDVEDNEKLNG